MKARGKRSEAERVAPGCNKGEEIRPEGPTYYAPSGLGQIHFVNQGRRALRLPLAFIFRAVGAAFSITDDF